MSINREEIIQIIAQEHNIILDKEDPILTFLAVHDTILNKYKAKFENIIEPLKEHLEEVTERHYFQSKDLAETLIGKTVTEIQQEGIKIEQRLQELYETERHKHITTIKDLTHQIEKSNKRNNITIWSALIISICTLTGAIILF